MSHARPNALTGTSTSTSKAEMKRFEFMPSYNFNAKARRDDNSAIVKTMLLRWNRMS